MLPGGGCDGGHFTQSSGEAIENKTDFFCFKHTEPLNITKRCRLMKGERRGSLLLLILYV